jgi:hypothetical protein
MSGIAASLSLGVATIQLQSETSADAEGSFKVRRSRSLACKQLRSNELCLGMGVGVRPSGTYSLKNNRKREGVNL